MNTDSAGFLSLQIFCNGQYMSLAEAAYIYVEVVTVEHPARKVKIIKKPDRLIILAGDKKVQDMLVFLMRKKLDLEIKNKQLKD